MRTRIYFSQTGDTSGFGVPAYRTSTVVETLSSQDTESIMAVTDWTAHTILIRVWLALTGQRYVVLCQVGKVL